jgi:hypothetical protein
MKAYKVKHQGGLLFNKENGKRIVLKEQFEFTITGEDAGFEEEDSLNKQPEKIRNSDEMQNYIHGKYAGMEIKRLLPASHLFVFRVGLGKTKQGDKGYTYHFLCKILEDLYAYRNKNSKMPRLCVCNCVVEKCLTNNLDFESVYAESLNQASTKTIMHYFPLKRSSSLNVINEFKPVISIEEYKEYLGGYNGINGLAGLNGIINRVFQK